MERRRDSFSRRRPTLIDQAESATARLLRPGDVDGALAYVGKSYVQHNPNAGDGSEGFRKFVGFLREKFHMNLALAGLTATAYIQLASAAGAPFGGFLADRLARRLPAGRMLTQMIGLTLGAGSPDGRERCYARMDGPRKPDRRSRRRVP